MASMEDIGAETKIISEDSDTEMGVSSSKSEVRVSGLGKYGDGGSAASGVAEPVAEADISVHASCDGNIATNNVLSDNEKDKIGDGCTNGSANVIEADEGGNGVVGNDEKGKDDDGSGRDHPNLHVDGDGEGEKDGEKPEDDQDNQLCVGDLVWGKIRSHPWWPGQVYDPKDASEFALKSKQKGRLLVAFFGDGSWSWCLPSQLVPFVENFAGMSRKSSSRSFLNAVRNAIDEVGRLVGLEMACNCVSKERKDGLARPGVENAGVKAGVLVPKVDSCRLSIRKYESKELLQKVRQFAWTVSVGNPVDLAVLRSCMSAFYHFKGGFQLTSYHEPLPVQGLEDKNDNADQVSYDYNEPIEAPINGPKDDDWHSSPTAGIVNSPSPSGNKVFHKRKRKSVAELMGDNKNTVEKPTSSRKGKKSNDGGVEEANDQGSSSIAKTSKKRKVEVTESDDRCSSEEKNGVNKGPSSGKSKKTKVIDVKITSDEAKEEPEMVSTPRERKKSKYLSPPYTNPTWRTGSFNSRTISEVEHDKNTRAGGRTTESTEERSAPEPVDKTAVEKLPNDQLESSEISVDANLQTVKDDKNLTSSASDVYASVSQLLLKTRLAAVDPFYLSEEGSLDTVWAFVFALRSSTYLHGPNYKFYRKCQRRLTRGKKKSGPSQPGKDDTQKQVNSPDQNASDGSKTEELSDASKSKEPPETSAAKSNAKKVVGKTLPCFIMEFVDDFPLPSKEDILRLFGKFGNLRRKDVKVVTESNSIQMFFTKYSDAEAAFKSSMSNCPFGFENVTCRLLHPSTSSKSGSPHPKVSPKWGRDNQERDLIPDARVISQKSEILTVALENNQSKLSPEDMSNLKEEMKHVIEKIEEISEKVRIIAENTSAS